MTKIFKNLVLFITRDDLGQIALKDINLSHKKKGLLRVSLEFIF